MALFEPASQNPNFDILYQQFLARQKNTEDLLQVVGDNSGLEGDFTTLEDVVTALVEQLPATVSPVATTSGTSVSLITTIPSWAGKVILTLNGVSTNGTSSPIIQLGTSGGLVTSTYSGSVCVVSATGQAAEEHTNGFRFNANNAAGDVLFGIITLIYMGSDVWAYGVQAGRNDAAVANVGGGTISLGGTLTQLAVTTVGGINSFDAGSIGVRYEY